MDGPRRKRDWGAIVASSAIVTGLSGMIGAAIPFGDSPADRGNAVLVGGIVLALGVIGCVVVIRRRIRLDDASDSEE